MNGTNLTIDRRFNGKNQETAETAGAFWWRGPCILAANFSRLDARMLIRTPARGTHALAVGGRIVFPGRKHWR
jgi:hypothetical protein